MVNIMYDIGILVIGHGSKLPYNKEIVESIAENIQKKHNTRVQTAYMSMNEPCIEDGLKILAATGVKKIVAVPAFLANGVHTLKDIPGILGVETVGAKTTIPIDGIPIELCYAGPIGADECIADIVFNRVQEVL